MGGFYHGSVNSDSYIVLAGVVSNIVEEQQEEIKILRNKIKEMEE